jgi:putative spermidine/putrescine transport system substrate-binding protein
MITSTRNIVAATVLLTGVGTALPAAAQESITVATYGGEWGAAMQACIIDPFTRDTATQESGSFPNQVFPA